MRPGGPLQVKKSSSRQTEGAGSELPGYYYQLLALPAAHCSRSGGSSEDARKNMW